MTTIKDVAARAGVSLGTASRVLSKSPHTSADSRAKVMQAAKQLGYVANGPAQSLRRARTNILGLLISDIRNPFFARLALSAEKEARKSGYMVVYGNANEDADTADEIVQVFSQQRVDGVLFSPQGIMTPHIRSFLKTGTPLVLLNRHLEGIEAPYFGTDNVQGMNQILQYLHERKHKRVAFVSGPTTISTGLERYRTFMEGRDSFGFDPDPRLVQIGNFLAEGGYRAAQDIIRSGLKPSAIIGANGETTVGILHALHDCLSTKEARRIEIVSFDDMEWFDFISPRISAVRNDATSIGREGAKGLIKLIQGKRVESKMIPTQFIDRSI